MTGAFENLSTRVEPVPEFEKTEETGESEEAETPENAEELAVYFNKTAGSGVWNLADTGSITPTTPNTRLPPTLLEFRIRKSAAWRPPTLTRLSR